jgi:hypothetical protein
MKNYDLTPLIKAAKEEGSFVESNTFYLSVIASLASLSVFLSMPATSPTRMGGLKRLSKEVYKDFILLLSKRFDSISFQSFQKSEVIDFTPEILLISAIRDFAIFAKKDKKIALMDLISSFRYFLAFAEVLHIDDCL